MNPETSLFDLCLIPSILTLRSDLRKIFGLLKPSLTTRVLMLDILPPSGGDSNDWDSSGRTAPESQMCFETQVHLLQGCSMGLSEIQ